MSRRDSEKSIKDYKNRELLKKLKRKEKILQLFKELKNNRWLSKKHLKRENMQLLCKELKKII